MKEKVEQIRKELENSLKNIDSVNTLNEIKAKFLGKKGFITELTSNMKDLAIEERKELGRISNELKSEVTNKIDELHKKIEEKILNEKLERESIDISLPSTKIKIGILNY